MKNKKTIFPINYQRLILEKLRKYIDKNVLPNNHIKEIVLGGSLTTGKFCKYERMLVKPKYRRLYSDIDLIFYVDEKFRPKGWEFFANPSKESVKMLGNFKAYRMGILDKKFHMIVLLFKEKPKCKGKTDIILYRRK